MADLALITGTMIGALWTGVFISYGTILIAGLVGYIIGKKIYWVLLFQIMAIMLNIISLPALLSAFGVG